MPKMTCLAVSAVRAALILTCVFACPSVPADPVDGLDRAITRFHNGDYLGAQEMLLGIDRDELNSSDQARRDDYVARCQVAITMAEKGLRDLEDAETAISEGETGRAESLLNGVLANEYAAPALRRAAQSHLRDLTGQTTQVRSVDTQPQPVRRIVETVPPAQRSRPDSTMVQMQSPSPRTSQPAARYGGASRARDLATQADELVRQSRFDEARRLYEEALAISPGFPAAVDGLNRLQQHGRNRNVGDSDSLIGRIRRENSINWQRAVTQYREIEVQIRDAVLAEDFDIVSPLLVRAKQIVESSRQFADPVTKYSNLKSEFEALDKQVRAEERAYNERLVAETRREIEESRANRLRDIDENRARQVDALMQQALQHRKDGDLRSAVNVLKQVTVIDPRHAPARWMLDMLEDERQFRRNRKVREEFLQKNRGAILDVEEAKIPWHEEIKYSDDWPEIITRDLRRPAGEEQRNVLILGALDRRVPVDFRKTPLDQVMQHFAQSDRLNLIVNWNELEKAGVDRKTPISLDLPSEITLKKALTEVLEQAGGGIVDLGYEVDEGVISVATRQFLDKKTFPVIYDISDLLMEVPNYTDAPMTDLRDATRNINNAARNQVDRPWQYGDDDDDEPESDPAKASRVRKIIELLQETVSPDSWRDRGGSVGTIREINGQLVITQNSASHRQIRGLLDKLRQERAIQVAVEALFITVSSHYLEELGIDLDIILNAGSAGFDFLNGGGGPLTDPVLGNRLLLPRSFSRLGRVPGASTVGAPLQTGGQTIPQPFEQPFLVPGQSGGAGSDGTPVPIVSNLLDITNPSNLPSDVPGSFGGQNIAPALSVFGSFLDNIQVDFLIRATQADSRSSVLTAPRLVVFNGASAWVAVTIQQNFVATLQPVVATGAVAVQPQTGTIDAGASLFVRATVTADRRYVLMLLSPGVTRLLDLQTFSFSGGTGAGQAFIQLPTLSAQRIQTMVSVPDGGTLLIGGQKLASETEVESGVPILSKIPILKRLYSARSMVKDEQVLLILIKPKILIHTEQEELAFPSFTQR